jgi:hypothetical protein
MENRSQTGARGLAEVTLTFPQPTHSLLRLMPLATRRPGPEAQALLYRPDAARKRRKAFRQIQIEGKGRPTRKDWSQRLSSKGRA